MNDKAETVATRASLIAKLKNWDDQTNWQEFNRTYRPLILAFALKQGLSETEAQDVAQDTLVSVAKGISEFEYDPDRSSFRNWLLTVTRHRIIDFCRKRQKEPSAPPLRNQERTSTSTLSHVPDRQNSALEEVWEDEWKRTIIELAIERLKQSKVSTQQFQIFYLSVLKKQSSAKVAAALGANVATVYVVRHRLAKKFEKIVAALREELG